MRIRLRRHGLAVSSLCLAAVGAVVVPATSFAAPVNSHVTKAHVTKANVTKAHVTKARARAATGKVLLALGDSLAAGYQPFDGKNPPPVDPTTGFADQGYPGSYPSIIARVRGLRLVDLGCPGETSGSMRHRPAQPACATQYRREFHVGSQLQAATTYLNAHRGQVAAVTIDIGGNDLDHCVSSSGVSASCLLQTERVLGTNFDAIVRTIKGALRRDDPNAPIATMNYYDPFLGLAMDPGGPSGAAHATESVLGLSVFNGEIEVASHLLGLKLANVAKAFKIDSALPLVSYRGAKLPLNVVTACRLTWMCPASNKTPGNVHPNNVGYHVIAKAFLAVLGR